MNRINFSERNEKILDEVNCWSGTEWEVLKLYCLFSKCVTTKYQSQEFVNINYVIEKVFNVLIKHPIILSDQAKRMYASMRMQKEDFDTAVKEDQRSQEEIKRLEAMEMIVRHGGHDGEHHKEWCLDQVFRILAGNEYQTIIDHQKRAGFEWKEGIAP